VIADDVVKNDAGEIVEVHCRYDADTLGSNPADGVKPKGVIHWVSARHGKRATVRLYDRLFTLANPAAGDDDFTAHINPDALTVLESFGIEPSAAAVAAEQRLQFERTGYFVADRYDHHPQPPVFNRTVTLRDTWGQQEQR